MFRIDPTAPVHPIAAVGADCYARWAGAEHLHSPLQHDGGKCSIGHRRRQSGESVDDYHVTMAAELLDLTCAGWWRALEWRWWRHCLSVPGMHARLGVVMGTSDVTRSLGLTEEDEVSYGLDVAVCGESEAARRRLGRAWADLIQGRQDAERWGREAS